LTKKALSSKLSPKEREERRAAALRENLRRRKAQQQARTGETGNHSFANEE